MPKNILWFSEISKKDIPLVGGKGANLGELVRAGITVPDGFVVTAGAYFEFLRRARLIKPIRSLLANLNPEDSKKLGQVAEKIQKLILEAPFPRGLKQDITTAYQRLYRAHSGGMFVAVRSSATAEDLPEASFAGQQATFLNVSGAEAVVRAVQHCYASLFGGRAIYYRVNNKFDHLKVGLAVPIQKMVQSETAGILFTLDPVNNDQTKITIEAGWGLGEAVVSGSITPDRYLVDKQKLAIVEREINRQSWKIQKVGSHDRHVSVAKDQQKAQKLTDEQIIQLSRLGKKIEDHYKSPQDTEWAIEEGKIYFVQSRPVTTLKKTIVPVESTKAGETQKFAAGTKIEGKVILHGLAASMGIAFGPAKVLRSAKEIDEVGEGDILVAEMTTPDFVPAMKKAVGIVTDAGGPTCHAAIVAREMGIPCVVGTGRATSAIKNGQVVTVDGTKGLIYQGKIEGAGKIHEIEARKGGQVAGYTTESPVTATKIYVNLAEPDLAADISRQSVDGVGLLRAEFMVAALGEHPRALVEKGQGRKYQTALSDGMRTISQAFNPRPVIYRATDFKTNEYRGLKGGEKYEKEESNPMLGYRGAFRYLKEPDLFKLELEALKSVREGYDLKNLHLMIPFIRTPEELKKVQEILRQVDLERSRDFKLWLMVEVPSTVFLIDEFLEAGIDGVSIGTNDLTQLILGIDRDNQVLAEEFDERHPAVEKALEQVIAACRRHHVTVSVCGQAPSVYPEVTEFLVRQGVTSISVTPDVILSTRRLVASVEKKLLLQKIIG